MLLSEFRVKNINLWSATYVALAVVFAWTYENSPLTAWFIPVATALITLLLWAGDYRVRVPSWPQRVVENTKPRTEYW